MSAKSRALSPGARLRGAREARGMSIEDVAERMRLNAALVLAMEEDRVALLGAPVFARGHLRNYAALVGVDEREVIEPGELPEPSFVPAIALRTRVRDRARWLWPVAAIALAVLVVAAFWWWNAGPATVP